MNTSISISPIDSGRMPRKSNSMCGILSTHALSSDCCVLEDVPAAYNRFQLLFVAVLHNLQYLMGIKFMLLRFHLRELSPANQSVVDKEDGLQFR